MTSTSPTSINRDHQASFNDAQFPADSTQRAVKTAIARHAAGEQEGHWLSWVSVRRAPAPSENECPVPEKTLVGKALRWSPRARASRAGGGGFRSYSVVKRDAIRPCHRAFDCNSPLVFFDETPVSTPREVSMGSVVVQDLKRSSTGNRTSVKTHAKSTSDNTTSNSLTQTSPGQNIS